MGQKETIHEESDDIKEEKKTKEESEKIAMEEESNCQENQQLQKSLKSNKLESYQNNIVIWHIIESTVLKIVMNQIYMRKQYLYLTILTRLKEKAKSMIRL